MSCWQTPTTAAAPDPCNAPATNPSRPPVSPLVRSRERLERLKKQEGQRAAAFSELLDAYAEEGAKGLEAVGPVIRNRLVQLVSVMVRQLPPARVWWGGGGRLHWVHTATRTEQHGQGASGVRVAPRVVRMPPQVRLLDNFLMPDDLPPMREDGSDDWVYQLAGRKHDKQLFRLAAANAEAEGEARQWCSLNPSTRTGGRRITNERNAALARCRHAGRGAAGRRRQGRQGRRRQGQAAQCQGRRQGGRGQGRGRRAGRRGAAAALWHADVGAAGWRAGPGLSWVGWRGRGAPWLR